MLGFRLTKAGAVVGWIYDPREPMGDNFVDFGMFEVCREKAVDFVNGYERSFILDFNVVGDITDALATHQTLRGLSHEEIFGDPAACSRNAHRSVLLCGV